MEVKKENSGSVLFPFANRQISVIIGFTGRIDASPADRQRPGARPESSAAGPYGFFPIHPIVVSVMMARLHSAALTHDACAARA
jgi:hypothetical protein